MIKLIADSTSYVPQEFIDKYDIQIVPLSVILGDEIIVETEITNEEFFEKLDASHHHPTSSQPTMGHLEHVFKSHAENGDDIIFITISSKMSGTNSTAQTIKRQLNEDYPDVKFEVIDSKSNCMQFGYAVLTGAKSIEAGMSFEETVAAVKDNVEKSRMLFIPRSLKYLQKSGRLSKANAIAASALKIVPILTVNDGKADVFAKIRTRKKAILGMINELKSDIQNKIVTEIAVIHINNEEEAKSLLEVLKQEINLDMIMASIGPVIGAHVGPGALGIVWCVA